MWKPTHDQQLAQMWTQGAATEAAGEITVAAEVSLTKYQETTVVTWPVGAGLVPFHPGAYCIVSFLILRFKGPVQWYMSWQCFVLINMP